MSKSGHKAVPDKAPEPPEQPHVSNQTLISKYGNKFAQF